MGDSLTTKIRRMSYVLQLGPIEQRRIGNHASEVCLVRKVCLATEVADRALELAPFVVRLAPTCSEAMLPLANVDNVERRF